MKRVIPQKRMVISKQMARAIMRAEAEIEREGDKQLYIQVCAAALALGRYWGWKRERLSKLLTIQQEIWHEVGSDNDVSMIHMAGAGFAVENASQAAKAVADFITVSNEEHAIARIIDNLDKGKIVF